jgi:hypothetical protein
MPGSYTHMNAMRHVACALAGGLLPTPSACVILCPLVNFFTSPDRVTAWSRANDVEGEPLALPVVTKFGTHLWRDALDAAAQLGPRLCVVRQP